MSCLGQGARWLRKLAASLPRSWLLLRWCRGSRVSFPGRLEQRLKACGPLTSSTRCPRQPWSTATRLYMKPERQPVGSPARFGCDVGSLASCGGGVVWDIARPAGRDAECGRAGAVVVRVVERAVGRGDGRTRRAGHTSRAGPAVSAIAAAAMTAPPAAQTETLTPRRRRAARRAGAAWAPCVRARAAQRTVPRSTRRRVRSPGLRVRRLLHHQRRKAAPGPRADPRETAARRCRPPARWARLGLSFLASACDRRSDPIACLALEQGKTSILGVGVDGGQYS